MAIELCVEVIRKGAVVQCHLTLKELHAHNIICQLLVLPGQKGHVNYVNTLERIESKMKI